MTEKLLCLFLCSWCTKLRQCNYRRYSSFLKNQGTKLTAVKA
uniref:Uncharacterized protein n=1 Tax=Medicago truncatula TaxID=3880 RepID=I3T1R0_MEDTR|nr:unknown [Medicago truncatula]